jgi:hypothetical protein
MAVESKLATLFVELAAKGIEQTTKALGGVKSALAATAAAAARMSETFSSIAGGAAKLAAVFTVAAGGSLGVRVAALDKAVWKASRWVQGAPGGPISRKEQRRRGLCAGLKPRRGGLPQRFFGEKPLQSHLPGG